MGRRGICLLLCLVLAVGMVLPAQAEAYDELRQLMKESFDRDEMLDISQYQLTLMEVQNVYDELYHSGQLPWYADEDCSYVFGDDQIIAKFRPKVLNAKVYDRELYEQKLAELIAATCLPEMTPWQKALSVHDYIVLYTAYDEDLRKNTGYDCLVDRSTVCYGYSMLYMDIMNRLGIPCQIVVCYNTGDGYGHAWNILQLDGQWYHVDLTWADPVPDTYGFVDHKFFLKTDREFRSGEEPHDFQWEALVSADGPSFEADDFLESVTSAVCFVDANTVIYRREKGNTNRILSRDLTTGEETTLYKYDRKDLNLGSGGYLYPTLGLSYWNGRVYFNREDRVISMLPDGSDARREYTHEVDSQYLLGCVADQGTLYLSLAGHDLQAQPLEVPLEDTQYHIHSYSRVTVKSTCLEEGYYEQVCQCGVAYNRVVIPKLDHLLQTRVEKAPTYEEPGITVHSCANCDYEQKEYPPALTPPEPEPEPEPDRGPMYLQLLIVGAGVLILVLLLILLLGGRKRRSKAYRR